jgi:ParB family chromosome partitioning protein
MSTPELYHDSIFWVEVDRIHPNPFQPRREFDQVALNELAESIRQYGVLQPLVVTRKEIPTEDGGLKVEYELIAGERRLRASRIAGLSMVPVVIRLKEESDLTKFELAIIENLHREDLNAVDRARAFERLSTEFSFSHSDIGKKLGKSREFVSNTIRLLLLPQSILDLLAEGKLSEGHSRTLLMLNDKPEEQMVLAKEAILKKLTVRETEHIARRIAHDKVRNKGVINPEIVELEKEFSTKLGTRVMIEPDQNGGKLVISYFSPEDLRAILESLQVTMSDEAMGVIASALQAERETAAIINDAIAAAANDSATLLDDRATEEKDYSTAEEAELYTIRNFSI